MHELSLVLNLVEIAEASAREAGAERVEVVHLQVGVLSGVVKEALLFAYDIATEGTLLEGSRLEVEELPVVVYCPACGCLSELPSPQHLACPRCGEPTADIRQGTELEIVSLEVMPLETEAWESVESVGHETKTH